MLVYYLLIYLFQYVRGHKKLKFRHTRVFHESENERTAARNAFQENVNPDNGKMIFLDDKPDVLFGPVGITTPAIKPKSSRQFSLLRFHFHHAEILIVLVFLLCLSFHPAYTSLLSSIYV